MALAHRRRLLEGELDASSSRSKGLLGGLVEAVELHTARRSGWGQGLCRAEHLVACRTARNGVVLALGHAHDGARKGTALTFRHVGWDKERMWAMGRNRDRKRIWQGQEKGLVCRKSASVQWALNTKSEHVWLRRT